MTFETLTQLLKTRYVWVFVVLLYVVTIGAAVFFFVIHDGSKTHTIELGVKGFSPAELVIEEGEAVVFTTNAGVPFWPASNVHPTHTAYPAFDPLKPIAADESWEFTFTQAGTYRFHDHIASQFEGEIVVLKKDGSRVSIDCSKEKTVSCWEKMMIETLNTEGIEAAFNQILHLSETEPLFANDCHGYAHLIGEKAYQLYTDDRNFELTPATALCAYGFYHGFMETLLLSTGDINEAREFCKMVDAKLAGQASAAATACYHGTGHGAIDGSDPTAWGDPDAMMQPGFKLCALLAEDDLQKYLCETGAYNAIEILSADPKYNISWVRERPFDFCNTQTQDRREACYSNMLPLLFGLYQNDFDAISAYINEHMIDHDVIAIDGHTINGMVTLGLMFEFVRIHGETEDYQERGIAFCHAQPAEDRLPCIEGLSGGHLKYGEPEVEYEAFLELCNNDLLAPDEREACYAYTLPRLDAQYTKEKTSYICSMVDVVYRERYCPVY